LEGTGTIPEVWGGGGPPDGVVGVSLKLTGPALTLGGILVLIYVRD
jgi:hypothetical protein